MQDEVMIDIDNPKDDCISRAELLKAVDTWDKFGFEHTGCFVREPKDDFITYVHYDDVIKCIKSMPSVQPKTEWIPVSERLPENKTYVLTTIHVPGRQPHARSGWYENGLFMNDNGDVWKSSDIEVKAWMPLPEPYKVSKIPTGSEKELVNGKERENGLGL